jgi:hypothetical protein
MEQVRHPTTVLSYAHRDNGWSPEQVSAWQEDVREFATVLLKSGIDVELDQWHFHESATDWTRWGARQVVSSDFTIIVINDAWRKRWQGDNLPGEGAGVVAEADTLRGLFWRDQAKFQRRTVIAQLPGISDDVIPPDLQRLVSTRIHEITIPGVERLVRILRGQPPYPKPPLIPPS